MVLMAMMVLMMFDDDHAQDDAKHDCIADVHADQVHAPVDHE